MTTTRCRRPRLARRAVRKSLVLLKNQKRLLPLSRSSKVLVVGKSADSLQNQTGGWSLSWQGTGNTNADFPNGTTILAALKQSLGDCDVTFSETGEGVDPSQYDAVIAVIGETPYAEGNGDIGKRSLDNALLHPEDLAVLDRVSGKGAPVATVFISGRPLYVNKELNRSDAFVAAWLPGTEGQGVADLLVSGRTSTASAARCPTRGRRRRARRRSTLGDEGYAPLFKLGYGLRSDQRSHIGQLPEETVARCVDSGGGGTTDDELELFIRQDVAPYKSYIGSPDNWGGTELGNDPSAPSVAHTNIEARWSDVNVQQDARKITWKGGAGQFYIQARRGRPAPVPQQQRRDRVRHDRDQGADGAGGDQRALHLPVLLRRADPQGVLEPRGRREAHRQDAALVPRHGVARVRPHQHAVPHLHRGRDGGLVRQRPVGAGRGGRPGRVAVL